MVKSHSVEQRFKESKERTQSHMARNMLELEFEPRPIGLQSHLTTFPTSGVLPKAPASAGLYFPASLAHDLGPGLPPNHCERGAVHPRTSNLPQSVLCPLPSSHLPSRCQDLNSSPFRPMLRRLLPVTGSLVSHCLSLSLDGALLLEDWIDLSSLKVFMCLLPPREVSFSSPSNCS